MTTIDQGLAVFGVTPRGGQHYLYDSVLGRIIGEGSARAVRAKVAAWAPLAPGRYQALSVDQVDARVLLDWQRFGTYNPMGGQR